GTTQLLDTIKNVNAKAIPVPPASFPGDITSASIATSADGLKIYGMGSSDGTFTFRYNVATHSVSPGGIVTTSGGGLGPRVGSLNADGSSAMVAWIMIDAADKFINYIPEHVSNEFSRGTSVFDNSRNLLYVHVPQTKGDLPVLQVMDSDNM